MANLVGSCLASGSIIYTRGYAEHTIHEPSKQALTLTLENDNLRVSLLDPQIDRDKRGTRFCSGGYIFQIDDAEHGPLLSGPWYPERFEPFDGQGIPDSFSRIPLRDPADPFQALIIGVGTVDLRDDSVVEYCDWQVDVGSDHYTFLTRHRFAGYSMTLRREVHLDGRVVSSRTRIQNESVISYPVSWFPHPFYPQPESNRLCRINVPVSLRENDGYELDDSGFIARKAWPWARDHFLVLDHEATQYVRVDMDHRSLGLVSASFGYVPGYFPIWGNENTFSFEPYYERHIGAGQTLAWHVDWDFNPS